MAFGMADTNFRDVGLASQFLQKRNIPASIKNLGSVNVKQNAVEFSKALSDLSSLVEDNVEKIIHKTALDLFLIIAQRTPKDTGRATASWNIQFTNFGDEEPKDFDNSDLPRRQRGMREAKEAARDFNYNLGDGDILLYNNLKYIKPLEDGHSKQAPAGMVALSLVEFAQILRVNFQELSVAK